MLFSWRKRNVICSRKAVLISGLSFKFALAHWWSLHHTRHAKLSTSVLSGMCRFMAWSYFQAQRQALYQSCFSRCHAHIGVHMVYIHSDSCRDCMMNQTWVCIQRQQNNRIVFNQNVFIMSHDQIGLIVFFKWTFNYVFKRQIHKFWLCLKTTIRCCINAAVGPMSKIIIPSIWE